MNDDGRQDYVSVTLEEKMVQWQKRKPIERAEVSCGRKQGCTGTWDENTSKCLFSSSPQLFASGNFSSLLSVCHLHESWKVLPVKPEP